MKCITVLSFVLSLCKFTLTSPNHEKHIPKLILISFDGFRWDYMDRLNPAIIPNFIKFRREGVYAREGIKNVFVTKTFPNHYTIVTGLYEESHGIVGNEMYDPLFDETFDMIDFRKTVESKWFTAGEPIWVTNQKMSESRRSGVAFWPCSIAPIKGRLPSSFLMYQDELPRTVQVDTLVNWFTDAEPINLGLIYMNEPDKSAHHHGPESPEVDRAIMKLDDIFGYLLRKLNDSGLLDSTNIILTSDHGMTALSKDRIIYLDDHVDSNWYRLVGGSTTVSIIPKPGRLDAMYEKLKDVGYMSVYKKADIPEEYHYKHHRRVTPLVLIAHLGYTILQNNASSISMGNHGYDNNQSDMHPFFMARGPAFKRNYSTRTFLSVDIYALMCEILSLKPAPNNGSLARVADLLQPRKTIDGYSTSLIYFIIIPMSLCVCGIFCVVTCCRSRITKRCGQTHDALHTVSFTKLPDDQRANLLESEDELP